MSALVTTLLATLIPLGYIGMAALTFFVAFVVLESGDSYDAAGSAGFIAAFWPVGLPLFLAYRRGKRVLSADGMSRKQRAQLAFERERAEIAAKALATQREWEALLAKEPKP